MTLSKHYSSLPLLLLLVGVSAPAHADETTVAATATVVGGRTFHADVEIDPTAYVLDGFSLHAGLGWNAVRIDLGVFAMAIPGAVHGQDGFDQSFDGYGIKVQWFPFHEQSGLFAGIDAGTARSLVRLQGTQLARRDRIASIGVNGGYRMDIAGGFYATAWLGLGYSVGAETIVLDNKTFESNPWTVFPAIHLGYHLR